MVSVLWLAGGRARVRGALLRQDLDGTLIIRGVAGDKVELRDAVVVG